MQMNRVEIAGYIAKRPDVRYLPSGMPVANARLGQTYAFRTTARSGMSAPTGTTCRSTETCRK